MSDERDVRRTINESADKIRLKAQVKRGSGTRDQDTVDIKVKGDDPERVVERLNATVALLSETTDELRRLQPEGDG